MIVVVAALLALAGLTVGDRVAAWVGRGGHRRSGDVVRRPGRPTWVRPTCVLVAPVVWLALAGGGRPALAAVAAPLVWVLVALAAVDLDVHRLPDAVQGPTCLVVAAALAVVGLVEADPGALRRSVLAALGILLVGTVAWLAAPHHGLGLGDVKLAGLLAAVLAQLGWSQVLLGLWLGLATGALAALVLLARRRIGPRDHLALGPALVVGALVTLVIG